MGVVLTETKWWIAVGGGASQFPHTTVVNKTISFISNGEKMKNWIFFCPDGMAKFIPGMGDVSVT